ncbi:caspase family protein [Allocoleopsis franciscana]|uniref:Peptidase C14 caspase domain-containing protein n=1 Tax=Allocoleopsis franciscana PCC 7113 TaxID=1173027 RepID=K9WPC2_9CYAN|nr:caspase family protein [Allocoleopsis franciscana]AFZ22033.1 hypothetical protein Mic7113_6453 [Allocoleopsis franciscana PCC 7113]
MDYRLGLQRLKELLPPEAIEEFDLYEGRLLENLKEAERYGMSPSTQADRNKIMSSLNQLARTYGEYLDNRSFNDLCHWARRSESPTSLTQVRGQESKPSSSLPPPGPIRKRWALLVGIDKYREQEFKPLKHCVSDVQALEPTLTKLGYEVVCMHSKLRTTDSLFPLSTNIVTQLSRLSQATELDDLLWVHFSCHGKRVQEKPVLIAYDTHPDLYERTALPVSDIRKVCNKVRRLVLTLDACHVGSEVGRNLPDPEFVHNVHELAEGFVLIAASTARQVAQEWKELGHGVFTHFLLEGLEGKADRHGNKYVTAKDLENYVLASLRDWSIRNKKPLQESTANTEGLGDMILAEYTKLSNQIVD